MKHSMLLDRAQWVVIFFFICFAWVTYQTFLLAGPFLPGVLGAVMLGIVFSPLYQRVLKRVRKPDTAAVLLTAGIFLLTVLPMVWILWLAWTEAEKLRPTLEGFIENYRTPSYIQGLLSPLIVFFEGFHVELKPFFLDNAAKISSRLTSGGSRLAGHLLITVFNGIVLMMTLFFVFRDGKKGAEIILSAIPMGEPNKQALLKGVYGTFRAVVAGVFVTAVTIGLADMAVFFVAGVPLPVFFGLVIAFFSLFGASVLVTIPAAFWVMNHDTGMGIFLLVWGIVVSVVSDNVLKPVLIGSRARMPFLIMFFSILGGMKLYGIMGLFLGPMVVTVFLIFWDIYRRDYKARTAD